MKFVIQRVTNASCTVDGNITGSIQKGFLVLIGISDHDTIQIADKMIKKLLGMRIFEDSDGKTNLSLHDVNGELLLISQFTLYADCKKGNDVVWDCSTRICRPTLPLIRRWTHSSLRRKARSARTLWLRFSTSR